MAIQNKENEKVKLTTMFLDFQGLPGDTKNKEYADQMELIGISHEIGYPTKLGDIPPDGNDSFNYELELQHTVFQGEFNLSYGNLQLLNQLWELRPIETAVLTILESNVEMLKMEFTNAIIREFSIILDDGTLGRENESDEPQDASKGRIAFSYDSVKYVYTSTNQDQNMQGTAVAELIVEF